MFALLFRTPPPPQAADRTFYWYTYFNSYLVLYGVLVAVFFLEPAFRELVTRWRVHWKPLYTIVAITATSVFVAAFLIHAGRHQFGGFDEGILIETGWRQILGQRPYTDFVTTAPPGFNLGIKYAFELFGVSWDANLYFSALFATLTMLWMYWLMRKAGLGILTALGTSFAIQCQTMLLLDFWWYNNSTLVLAAVFLLSCLAYALCPESIGVQISYFVALALFSLMKPNIAGIAIPGGAALLLVLSTRRLRFVLLTVGSAAAALAILLINHVSILAMLASYHEASKFRGGFSIFGLRQQGRVEACMALVGIYALAIPGLWILPRIFRQLRDGQVRSAALLLFYPLAFLISTYGLMTNGELWPVECSPLLVAAAFFCFSEKGPRVPPRRLVTSLICAGIAACLFTGAVRLRIYGIGPKMFFEWNNNNNVISDGFLKDMRVGVPMYDMERQITSAVHSNSGPYFFGPRVDFNYAVQHIPSPDHFPAWWHPGVSFGIDQESSLVEVWKDHHFQTLIFLKGDYTFYPPDLLDAIHRDYVRDDSYAEITVYHRLPAAQ
jgi:hypothetical protein